MANQPVGELEIKWSNNMAMQNLDLDGSNVANSLSGWRGPNVFLVWKTI